MRDRDVRLGLAKAVRSQMGATPHLLVPEVEIRWSTPARMDVLLVADRIAGFEIKSDVDSLSRLPRQINAYGDVVEQAHLVVGRRHQQAATALVPDWWSIWVAEWVGDAVEVRRLRRGRLNPNISPLAVTTFLSRCDLTAALRYMGERQLSSKSVDELRTLLVGRLGLKGTLDVARAAMLARQDWHVRSLPAP